MEGEPFKINSDPDERASEILARLSLEFKIRPESESDPFPTLVGTVLSQNTNRKNTSKAWENLSGRYSTPSDYVSADLKELEELIRPAGLYKSKSKRLKSIAKILMDEYDGDLSKILEKEVEEARKDLLDLPGVGPKTADCVLLFAGNRDVLPVDTHVERTLKRLGFVDPESDSEGAKEQFEKFVPEGKSREMHLLLIELGRNVCKARGPICNECPLKDLCPKIGV